MILLWIKHQWDTHDSESGLHLCPCKLLTVQFAPPAWRSQTWPSLPQPLGGVWVEGVP